MNQYTSLWAFSLPMIAFLIALAIGLAYAPDKSESNRSMKSSEEKALQTEEQRNLLEGQQ